MIKHTDFIISKTQQRERENDLTHYFIIFVFW